VLATREELRSRIETRYSFALHAVAIHLVVLAYVATALAFIRDLRLDDLWAAPATFLFANVVEYLAHRFPMHHRTRALAIIFDRHNGHHAFFRTDTMRVDGVRDMRFVMFPAWAAAIVLALASPLGLWVAWFTGSRNMGLLYVATAALYYLLYEWLHASYHLFPDRVARVPVLGKASARHALHHDPSRMTEVNFNITFPIVDGIVGTRTP
jgi:hypothetical protein